LQEVAEMLTSELRKRCEESPGVAENALLAQAALALALPPSAHTHVETISDSLLAVLKRSDQGSQKLIGAYSYLIYIMRVEGSVCF
jgi:hypothetical protein